MKGYLKAQACLNLKNRKEQFEEITTSQDEYQTKIIRAYVTLNRLVRDLSRAVPGYLHEDLQACLALNDDIWMSRTQNNARSESLPTANER